jgi:hypothetical protein
MEMQVMAEKVVLIMRHAEKTDDPENQSLAKAGRVRAKRLAKFIPDKFGLPDFIFASAISRHSARPYETMVPLSKKAGVPIDATIADNGYGVLAKTILKKARYDGTLTIVCCTMVRFRQCCTILARRIKPTPITGIETCSI